jgi:hypothetical protein
MEQVKEKKQAEGGEVKELGVRRRQSYVRLNG